MENIQVGMSIDAKLHVQQRAYGSDSLLFLTFQIKCILTEFSCGYLSRMHKCGNFSLATKEIDHDYHNKSLFVPLRMYSHDLTI